MGKSSHAEPGAGRKAARSRVGAAIGLFAVGLAGCEGSSTSPRGEAPAEKQEEVPICSAAGALGAAPLRRLTRFEYGRTLADLMGADAKLAEELPPDEKSLGFDGMADTYSVSTLHAAKYLEVAERAAATFVADKTKLAAFAGCDPSADSACVDPFVRAFGRRAFRRTLTEPEVSAMLGVYAATADPTPTAGVTAVVATLLQTPQFLYRPEPSAGEADFGAPLATRLAYLITASGPDAELLDAAEQGQLSTPEGLLAQADRLLESPRAREAFSHFMLEWWDLEALRDVQKDQSLYRTWTQTTAGELAGETQAFINAAWDETPSLEVFLGAPYTYLNSPLATFYGVGGATGVGFTRVALDPSRAAGLLTQGAFLAVHAKPNQTSPIHRGKFVRERLFCDPPEPPPPDLVVTPPIVDPRLSTRERFAAHTASATCAGCHVRMDPIGFLFEHYDAVGRWRDVDGGKPVDSTGFLDGTDVDGDLDGVPALAQKLLESKQVQSCVARQWFRYAFGREATSPADQCTIGALSSELERTGGDLRAVIRTTALQELFRSQRAAEATP